LLALLKRSSPETTGKILVDTISHRIKLIDVYPARSKIVGSTSEDLYAHPRCLRTALPRAALDPLLDSYKQDDQDIHTKHRHIHDQVLCAGNSDPQILANFSGDCAPRPGAPLL
jgi:hypothetical protein